MNSLQTVCEQMIPILRQAGAEIRNAYPRRIRQKSGHTDLVTEYDVAIQKTIAAELSRIDPEAAVTGEEEGEGLPEDGDCFLIDPIDGTANFVMGYRRCGISAALLRKKEPLIGVVYDPWEDRMYTAVRGQGAFCNGEPIRVNQNPMRDCLIAFGTAPYTPELMRRTLRITEKILETAVDVRRTGSAALDLCDTACGRCGAFFELKLSPWDYAAGGLIVTEAGGTLTDAEGKALTYDRPNSVAAGGGAYGDLLRILKETE